MIFYLKCAAYKSTYLLTYLLTVWPIIQDQEITPRYRPRDHTVCLQKNSAIFRALRGLAVPAEMDVDPFIPTQPNPTHKLSNATQNVINTLTRTIQPKLPNPMYGEGMFYF